MSQIYHFMFNNKAAFCVLNGMDYVFNHLLGKGDPFCNRKCKLLTLVTLEAFAIKKLFITAPSHCIEKHSNELRRFNQTETVRRTKLCEREMITALAFYQ